MASAQTDVSLRRNKPGCKAEEFYNWPDEDIEQMESTLSVQQFIQQSIRRNVLDVDGILAMPQSQDEGVWKYEHMRQFCMDLNDLTVLLQEECKPAACTKMMATDDWVFLCAAHKQPKECSAIDYTRHTLDGAASLLNSSKYFPSRVTVKETAIAKLGSICRRIYRIFAHAFFHHREAFDQFELETALCLRFTKFVRTYSLMTDDNLLVRLADLEAIWQKSTSLSPPSSAASTVLPQPAEQSPGSAESQPGTVAASTSTATDGKSGQVTVEMDVDEADV